MTSEVTNFKYVIVLVLRSDLTRMYKYNWDVDTGLSPSKQVTELYRGHELVISGKKQSPKPFGHPVYEKDNIKTYYFDVDYLPLVN